MESTRHFIPFSSVVTTGIIILLLAHIHSSLSSAFRTINESITDQGSDAKSQQRTHEGDINLDNSEKWGLPDRVAYAGKLFRYHLSPEEYETGVHQRYQMTKSDVERLPEWLYWNEELNSIEGIPRNEHIDDVINVQLTIVYDEWDNEMGPIEKEYFSIIVKNTSDENYHANKVLSSSNNEIRLIECGLASSVTQATVIIDAILYDLTARQSVALIDKLSSYLNLPVTAFSLISGENKPLWDADALVAGPGDTPKPINLPGLLVQWVVGCGNVQTPQMEVLELLESAAINGSLSSTLGKGIIGWHITNNRPAERNKIKRQVHVPIQPTSTLLPSMNHPTAYAAVTHFARETQYPQDYAAHRPGEMQTSLWLRPQLEISIMTKPQSSRQPRPTGGGDFGPTQPTSIIQPTRAFETSHTTSWPGRYPPSGVHSSTEWPARPAPGYPGYIEPSIEYGRPTPVAPTASLPEWSKHPDRIDSTTTWTPRYPPYTEDYWPGSYLDRSTPGGAKELPDKDPTYPIYTARIPVQSSGLIDELGQSTSKPFEDPWATRQEPTATSGWLHPSTVNSFTPPTFAVTSRKRKTTTPSPEIEAVDKRPRLLNALGRIQAEVGRVLTLKIPIDTFYDDEEGFTNNLKILELADEDRIMVNPHSWIKMNETSQTIYGFALPEHIGTHRFIVAAVDQDKYIVESPLEVNVRAPENADRLTHEFTVILAVNYDNFVSNVSSRIDIVSKLAQAFGDSNAEKVTVTKVLPGSVEMHWTNNSLLLEPCPKDAIVALKHQMLRPDGSINPRFVRAMRPYTVLFAAGKPLGICSHRPPLSVPDFTTPSAEKFSTSPSPHSSVTQEPVEPARKEVAPSNFLLYVVIAIIIFMIIVVIMIIICVVCYKKQRNRHERKQNEEDIGTTKKGIPIIFADELEQSGAANAADDATPVSTLKSVKSVQDTDTTESVPPPEYSRSKPGSASSTLRSDWKAPLLTEQEDGQNNEQDDTLEKTKVKENDTEKHVQNRQENKKSVR